MNIWVVEVKHVLLVAFETALCLNYCVEMRVNRFIVVANGSLLIGIDSISSPDLQPWFLQGLGSLFWAMCKKEQVCQCYLGLCFEPNNMFNCCCWIYFSTADLA